MDFTEWLQQGNEAEARELELQREMEEYEANRKAMSRKTTPFEFITAIQEKKDIFTEQNAKHYAAHVVNLGLSQHLQNISFCYEASKLQLNLSGLPAAFANELHYQYLYNTIRKGKQFGKWAKVEKYDNLELIMDTYKVNRDEGIGILNRLTSDEIQRLVDWDATKAGGVSRAK